MIAVLPRTSDAAARRGLPRRRPRAPSTRSTCATSRAWSASRARSWPGPRPAVAEDVVQEAMLRASRALLRDDREIDLKPWLFRLTRNCALDELSRVKGGPVTLDDEDDARSCSRRPPAREPEESFGAPRRRARACSRTSRRCPRTSATRSLRRELDGRSHEEIARRARAHRRSPRRASCSARGRTSCASARRAPRTAPRSACGCSRRPTRTAARTPQTLRHVAKCPAVPRVPRTS